MNVNGVNKNNNSASQGLIDMRLSAPFYFTFQPWEMDVQAEGVRVFLSFQAYVDSSWKQATTTSSYSLLKPHFVILSLDESHSVAK